VGTLNSIISINLHNVIDSGCDEPRQRVESRGGNSQTRILCLQTNFVLFL